MKPEYERIRAPVLGLFAEKDAFVTPEAVRKLEEALKAAGVPHEGHIHEDAGHGFNNDATPARYNEAAAEKAWKRTIEWFNQYVRV